MLINFFFRILLARKEISTCGGYSVRLPLSGLMPICSLVLTGWKVPKPGIATESSSVTHDVTTEVKPSKSLLTSVRFLPNLADNRVTNVLLSINEYFATKL